MTNRAETEMVERRKVLMIALALYLIIGVGSAARVYKNTTDLNLAWVAFALWPAAIGWRLASDGPPIPTKESDK